MSGGSQQLRQFRRAIRDGATLEQACAATGNVIGLEEGKIHLARDARDPPPPEAYTLIYDPDAPAAASSKKEDDMASALKSGDGEGAGISGEYKRPDAAKAFEIYDKKIKPKLVKINTANGECSQPWQDIKEHAHFPRPVMNFLIMLENIEDDAKRDHFLLALSGGLENRKLFLPRDLVTMADGRDGASIIPIGERKKPQLATLQMGVPSDGSETDLAGAGEDGFDEATPEELAAQKPRREAAEKKSATSATAETVN